MKKKELIFESVMLMFFIALLISCKEQEGTGSLPYDPDKPVTLDSFSPSTGGMATRVILSGDNFGNDPKMVKVYFNNKRAPVIGCDKGKILCITPRQPGKECVISVVVGDDSLNYNQKYMYQVRAVVTTIVGQKGTETFKTGSFAEATLNHPSFITVDNESNLFVSHWDRTGKGFYNFIMCSQQNKTVTLLASTGPANVPTTDINGKVILVPLDSGDDFYMFDPDAQWASRKRTIIHPTDTEIAAGKKDFKIDYKHGFAVCKLDGMIYTRAYNGQLIKFDPLLRKGEQVEVGLNSNSDSYLQFDPVNKSILYISYPSRHCIYTYNILTREHKIFAGSLSSTGGWKDGKKEDALFNQPRQIILDENNNLIVADQMNHCIRKISVDGTVTTLIGMGGKAGYQDGNPDDALFNQPRGMAIDKDYNIYIADYMNNCIRKLSIE